MYVLLFLSVCPKLREFIEAEEVDFEVSTEAPTSEAEALGCLLLTRVVDTGDLGLFEAAAKCVSGRYCIDDDVSGVILRPEGWRNVIFNGSIV